eukprot:gnl/TRDRNA2_/TRDRNA2_137911_c0_seq2.p1 gnl/TRDRNA2_/TRDRNA2_137911_c0~~gnl/TRDRNA2_/TRDRNA2_137911_c0_seq2.p1  ORF type:complete len:407 (+),score=48.32 gnl/TRDRNA2_/TRDRNA2_137911_c0_seq2:48-1223(+)
MAAAAVAAQGSYAVTGFSSSEWDDFEKDLAEALSDSEAQSPQPRRSTLGVLSTERPLAPWHGMVPPMPASWAASPVSQQSLIPLHRGCHGGDLPNSPLPLAARATSWHHEQEGAIVAEEEAPFFRRTRGAQVLTRSQDPITWQQQLHQGLLRLRARSWSVPGCLTNGAAFWSVPPPAGSEHSVPTLSLPTAPSHEPLLIPPVSSPRQPRSLAQSPHWMSASWTPQVLGPWEELLEARRRGGGPGGTAVPVLLATTGVARADARPSHTSLGAAMPRATTEDGARHAPPDGVFETAPARIGMGSPALAAFHTVTAAAAASKLDFHTVTCAYRAPTDSGDTTVTVCAICMERFVEGDCIRLLPCLHRYHVRCVDRWLVSRWMCPICKNKVVYSG